MTTTTQNRRLAAIMFTDIAGYTAMMQKDEDLAMAAVRRHHLVLQDCVPAERGEIQQYYGDGSLSIFNSATDAVRCAMEFQKRLLTAPEVPVRVGIHIGEIHTEDGKIFGDGVNLASRIESIGQAGCVLFSRHVYEKVRNHTEFQIQYFGAFEFKNVDEPVEVYALANPEVRVPDDRQVEGKLKPRRKHQIARNLLYGFGLLIVMAIVAGLYLFPKVGNSSPIGFSNSIAVLQFENRSKDPDQDFLSIGIPEDILTELAQIRGLKVISRASSMLFQDPHQNQRTWKQIGEDLGVANLLAGSVLRIGNSLHVNVKLIDAKQENIIWAEKFTRDFEDVLSVQQEIAAMVSEKLEVTLAPHMKSRYSARTSVNQDAYVNYLKGTESLLRSSGSPGEVSNAINYFETALTIDSNFAKAWVGLADAHLESVFWHRATDGVAMSKATTAAIKAIKLDENLGDAYAALGAIDLYSGNIREAEYNLNRALTLNPNSVFAHDRMAWAKMYSGKRDQAFAELEKAIELDPLSTRLKGALANAYYFSQQYRKGLACTREFLEQHPKDNFILWANAYLAAAAGDYQAAIDTLDQRTIGRGTNWVYAYCYGALGRKDEAQEILDTLLARDARGFVPDFMIAVAYTAVGDYTNAINRLETATGKGGESFFLWGIGKDPMLKPLRKDPRFRKIVDRISTIYRE